MTLTTTPADRATRPLANAALWGGAAVALSAVLYVLAQLPFRVPGAAITPLFLLRPAILIAAPIALAAGLLVLAFGTTGGRRAVGSSGAGHLALVAFAATTLLGDLVLRNVWSSAPEQPPIVLSGIALALPLLGIAAALVAGIAVARAGVLRGFARLALVLFGGWQLMLAVVYTMPALIPTAPWQELADILVRLGDITLLLQLAWGLSYLAHGLRTNWSTRRADGT